MYIYIYTYTTIAIQSYTDTNTHRRFKQAHKHPAGPETVLVKIEFYKKNGVATCNVARKLDISAA